MWCAAGVNLTGGKTRDGGDIVGASVFYSQLEESGEHVLPPNDAVDSLDHELKVKSLHGSHSVDLSCAPS